MFLCIILPDLTLARGVCENLYFDETVPSKQPNSRPSSVLHVLHSGPIWVIRGTPADVQLGNWSARYTLRNDGPLVQPLSGHFPS